MEQKVEISSEQFSEFLREFFGGGHEDAVVDGGAAVTESVGELLGGAGMTVLIGLVVVIGVLLLLTGVFYLFGFVMSGASRKAKKKDEEKKAPSDPAPAAVSAPAPAVQEGISGEVVAAIAAAVAMMAPDGKRYTVKNISRRDAAGRSAWAAAGVADNTRPF